jgi:pyruvate/2-oxoglutarate/acetoin dehydrogenase E1 component
MSELEFRAAVNQALDEELARDERVVFFGEDVAAPGGVFATTGGLQDKHGRSRVFDTPIAELAMSGAAFGAAVTGLRPVVEIMFGDFLLLAMDSLVNQAAKYWFVSNEQSSVPLVVRSAVGAGGRFGAIHSQMPIPWFQGVPGIKVVAPATPRDAKALLKAAIRDDNPVVFLEHKRLYSMKGPAGKPDEVLPLGQAAVLREGADLTVVSVMKVCTMRWPRPRRSPPMASSWRSSTCARCARSTRRRCSRRCARPTGCSSSRRGRAPAAGRAACLRRWSKAPSSTSTTRGA